MWATHAGAFQSFLESVLLTACSRGATCAWGESLFQGQCYVVLRGSCPVLFLLEASWALASRRLVVGEVRRGSMAPPGPRGGTLPFCGGRHSWPPGHLYWRLAQHPTPSFGKSRRIRAGCAEAVGPRGQQQPALGPPPALGGSCARGRSRVLQYQV